MIQQTAANFILSGATAIGVGTELIPTEAIERRQSQRIHELARRFAKLVKDARDQIEAWKKSQVIKEYTGAEKCEKQGMCDRHTGKPILAGFWVLERLGSARAFKRGRQHKRIQSRLAGIMCSAIVCLSVFSNPAPLTSARADTVRIPGTGRLWRN